MNIYRHISIIVALAIVIIIYGCNSQDIKQNDEKTMLSNSIVEKIEIYHFHSTQQCYSCKTVGEYAQETVNLFFSEEKKSGRIVFDHINIDLPQNAELVKKYGVAGSSLWIGVYDNNGFHKEENVNVWYKIDNKDGYLLYLKSIINKRLDGDYSQ